MTTGQRELDDVAGQVDDLRERMRLLQGDRRANVDILEANKSANKEQIKRLREENKEIRIKLSVLQRSGTSACAVSENLEADLIKVRKQFDILREHASIKSQSLDKLKDDVRDLELQSKKPNQEDSPVTRNIRMLENRLDKALIKFNEAQSIKKTYEQIVKRLREERIGFDHQLAALERTYASKQRDYEELLLLSGDANHAREVAQTELDHVRSGYEEERRRRDSELRERHQMVQLRKQTLERLQKREVMTQQIIAQEAGGSQQDLKTNIPSVLHVSLSKERMEQRTKIDIFETAFRKIKEATGVSDVNEVIQKIVSQESTTENLMSLTKENQQKIESFNEQKIRIKMHVEEIKYSGQGGGHRRKLVDDHEELVAASATRLERCRAKHERLARMLIAIKAGVKHLQDKLDGVREEIGGKQLQLNDETVVRVMSENEKLMMEVLARIRVATDDDSIINKIVGITGEMRLTDVDEIELLRARPYNQRIDLPLLDGDWDHDEGALKDTDDLLGGELDDELTRDKVKKASSQILIAQIKRKARKKNGSAE